MPDLFGCSVGLNNARLLAGYSRHSGICYLWRFVSRKIAYGPFGVLVLGVVTAVGGGTIRDMALDHGPVFWVKDPTDLVVAMVTSMLTIVLVRQPRRLPKWMLPVLDAVGLGGVCRHWRE